MNTKRIIGILLIFAFLTSVVTSVHITPVNAQVAPTQKTYAIADAIPNPTGVGQETLLKFGISSLRLRRSKVDRHYNNHHKT